MIKNRFTAIMSAIVVIFVVLLAGCAEVSAFRAGVADHGADAADQALDTALFTLCNATPVGAVNRRFQSTEQVQAYQTLCPGSLAVPQ